MTTDPLLLNDDDPVAVALTRALRQGAVEDLQRLLASDPALARARIVTPAGSRAGGRSLLHVLTDWPGPATNGPALVAALVARGAEVDAPFLGGHTETALHWAASCDDVAVVDALVDAGADLERDGGVMGTPLADAVAFGQWNAARRLLERGAAPNLWQAAALGLVEAVRAHLAAGPGPDALTNALWCACHGGQRGTAELLLDAGGDPSWVGHDGLTPLDAARRSGAADVVAWLSTRARPSAAP
jgi:hypothetical protein